MWKWRGEQRFRGPPVQRGGPYTPAKIACTLTYLHTFPAHTTLTLQSRWRPPSWACATPTAACAVATRAASPCCRCSSSAYRWAVLHGWEPGLSAGWQDARVECSTFACRTRCSTQPLLSCTAAVTACIRLSAMLPATLAAAGVPHTGGPRVCKGVLPRPEQHHQLPGATPWPA